MSLHNDDIAGVFDEIADLLDLDGANPFRIRAYRRAALMLRGLEREVAELYAAGRDLRDLPGIGDDLATQMVSLLRTGRDPMLTMLRRRFPRGATALLRLPGLGPKRVRQLIDTLRVGNVAALRRALAAGRVQKLRGFGPALVARLEAAVAPAAQQAAGRWSRHRVRAHAAGLAAMLRRVRGVEACEIAGSWRRGRDTIGDLDVVVAAADAAGVRRALGEWEDVARLEAAGPTKLTATLRAGLQVDVRVVPPQSFGAALYYFTGSKAHNIRVRSRARAAGLKINEYGVYRGTKRIAGATEAEVFRAVGLPFIPPELREDRGEIEAALAGRLPRLVERADLRGDLHVHTTASDGRLGLEALARAARTAGLEYVAITDHAQHLGIVRGLDAGGLARQGETIDRLNEKLRGIRLLKGVEVDILPDGRLALPDEALRGLDVVIAAVHTSQRLTRAKQTARVLRALDHPAVAILAHPTGRLLGEREPLQLDLERIVTAAAGRGVALELNTQPARLDLDDLGCRLAREAGAWVCIASDAHDAAGFGTLEDGVTQARRGWLEAGNVLNTRPLRALLPLLGARRA